MLLRRLRRLWLRRSSVVNFTVEANDTYLQIRGGKSIETVFWRDVQTVHAFKRDVLVYDLICLLITLRGSLNELVATELNEEMDGYKDVVASFPQHLIGCVPVESWFSAVAFPPFERNMTKIYDRTEAN